MASIAVGSLIILGTLGALHFLGRTLTAREDRARAAALQARIAAAHLHPPRLASEEEVQYDDRTKIPNWLGYHDKPPKTKSHVL